MLTFGFRVGLESSGTISPSIVVMALFVTSLIATATLSAPVLLRSRSDPDSDHVLLRVFVNVLKETSSELLKVADFAILIVD